MRIEQFEMERMQSTYENQVELNLSESGVHPLTLGELVEKTDEREALLHARLAYTQSNGTPELRAAIAGLYPGATIEHVEVTNGGSEANYLVVWHLVEPGEEVVQMVPTYMQTWGLARGFGGTVKEWPLRPDGLHRRWRPDLDLLTSLVGPRTKLIIICNPNNPTGARLEEREIAAICEIAARHGAWLLADEIYRGAERDGRETSSVWGRYERAIVTSGLSKAYGLPGLRIGWIVGPPPLVASLWSYHDYTTIAPGALSDWLARLALEPARRARILARTRGILTTNYPVVDGWLAEQEDACSHIPPDAGAIVYVRYRHRVNSTELVTRLREAKSVLVVPGDHFGMDGYLRIGYGLEIGQLRAGLSRLEEVFDELVLGA